MAARQVEVIDLVSEEEDPDEEQEAEEQEAAAEAAVADDEEEDAEQPASAAASEAESGSDTTIDATSDDVDDANDAKDPSWTPEHELGDVHTRTPVKPVVGPVHSPRLSQPLLYRWYSPSGQKTSAQPKDLAAAAAAGQDQHASTQQQQQQACCAGDAAAAASAGGGGGGASHRLRQSHQPFAAAASPAGSLPPSPPASPGPAAATAAWQAVRSTGDHERTTSAPGARSLWEAVEAAADEAGAADAAAAAAAGATRAGAGDAAGAAAPGAVAVPAEAAPGAEAAAADLRARVLALLNGRNGYSAGISRSEVRAALEATAGRVLTEREQQTVKGICRQFRKQQQQQQEGLPATAPDAAQAAGGQATEKQRSDVSGLGLPGAAAAAAAAAAAVVAAASAGCRRPPQQQRDAAAILARLPAAVPAPQHSSLLAVRRPAPFSCPEPEPQQDPLTRQFGVWPETDASGDLLPSNCCSDGTAVFLSAFVAATLPPQAAASGRPSRLGRSQQAAAAALAGAKGGRKRGRPAKGSRQQATKTAAAAGAAAGSSDDSHQTPCTAAQQQQQQQQEEHGGLQGLVTQQQQQQQRQQQRRQRQLERYGFCWRDGGSSRQLVVLADLGGSTRQHSLEPQQQQQQRRRPRLSSLDAVYGWSVTAPQGSVDYAAAMRGALQQAALALAPADPSPGAAGEADQEEQEQPASDDEFYQAVELADGPSRGRRQKTSFNMAEAPVRRFYQLYWSSRELQGWTLLRPVALATSRGLDALVRRLSLLTRVEVVGDPCHPCLHNPLEPALPPQQPLPSEEDAAAAAAAGPPQQRAPLMLLAARALPANQLLGLYWGSVLTLDEDTKLAQADLSGAYGMQHAYTTDVDWSKSCLPAPPGKSLVVVGDAAACRIALLNDAKHWAQEMGPCPRAALGTCTCSRYADRAANVRFESHLVYRASNGSYLPALAVFTKDAVAAGAELLADYGQGGEDGFWDIINSNVRQYNFIHRLQLQAQGLARCVKRMQAAARVGVVAAAPPGGASPAAAEQQQVLHDIYRMADDALQQHVPEDL